MAATVTQLVQGPADLWTGAFGAIEPVDTAVTTEPGAGWTDVGGTEGGVNLTVNQEYSSLAVDQIVDNPGRRLTSREFSLSTNLAELTLDNLSLALNRNGTSTTGAGFEKFEPATGSSATQPTYSALLLDGWAPEGVRRRIIGRKMLSTDNVAFAYSKDGQSVFAVTFSGHYVSTAIKPFAVIDVAPVAP